MFHSARTPPADGFVDSTLGDGNDFTTSDNPGEQYRIDRGAAA